MLQLLIKQGVIGLTNCAIFFSERQRSDFVGCEIFC